mgnify:CR=1 FL=1
MTGPDGVEAEIRRRLEQALAPVRLDVVNESALHAGHAGDDGSGESHFRVLVESAAFAGRSRVVRQRMVNAALADLLASRVHALALRCLAPGEDG